MQYMHERKAHTDVDKQNYRSVDATMNKKGEDEEWAFQARCGFWSSDDRHNSLPLHHHTTASAQLVHVCFFPNPPATRNHRNPDNFPSSRNATELTGVLCDCMVKQFISVLPCLREQILEVDEEGEGAEVEEVVEAVRADIRIKRKQRSKRKNLSLIWKSI